VKQDYKKLAISLLLPLIAATIGSYFTFTEINTWYAQLNKPFYNPPNWLFGPVWSILYILMGVSYYIIWTSKTSKKKLKTATNAFITQLSLNTLWSVMFFGRHQILLSLLEIVALLNSVAIMIYYFNKINKNAAKLQIPYLLWCGFATILNLGILLLN